MPVTDTIYGDYGASESFSVTGKRSQWVAFELLERANGGYAPNFLLEFFGASGATYELTLLRNNCAGTPLVVEDGDVLEIPDTAADDSSTMYVHIDQIAGPCPTSGSWRLDIEGNY